MTDRKVIDLTQLANASEDADTLAETINGDEYTDVTSRLGQKYPTVAKALRIIRDNAAKQLGRVDSIAALRQYNKQVMTGSRLIVDAYYAGQHLGGGEFVADTSDKTTPDDGGIVVVATNGTRWKRIVGGAVSLSDFGVVADGSTDNAEKINKALEVCAGRYEVVAPPGVIMFGSEIKLPSHLVFRGAGIDKTIFRATNSLPAISNGMTNAGNNYEVRDAYDVNIHISDFTLDHNHMQRYRIGTHINNQACGIKYSAVRGGSITRVKSINAVLHCFDVAADQYVTDGGVTNNATNKSFDITIKECIAINPYRDDCFTTHNSSNITFDMCLAEHTGEITPLGNTQQGFEADEGSEYISFRNCRAINMYCGFQSKGHDTTKPARGVNFTDCIASGCAYGFMFSVGTNPIGKPGYDGQGVFLTNGTVLNPTNRLNTAPVALYVYGADAVVVQGMIIDGNANIQVLQGARRVTLRDIVFNTKITVGTACIDIQDTAAAHAVIDNISSVVQQDLPMIAKRASGAILRASNLYLRGSGANAIYLNRSPHDTIDGAWNWGYTNTVFLHAEQIGLTGQVNMRPNNMTEMFGVANSAVKAPIGTRMYYQNRTWAQTSSNANTPNWVEIL